jgi:ABC-type Mn2+/Zn2+ transport system permease subunit
MWVLEKKTDLPLENLAAIVFASGVGSALIFLPMDEAETALVGNIENISIIETIFIVISSVLLFLIIKYVYNKIMLMNVDEDLASIEGINVDKYNLIYLLSIAVVVALSVYLVGALITAALIALPAASAKNTSKDLVSYKIEAVLYGVLATVIGIALGITTALPIGPLIIIAGTVLFLLSVAVIHFKFK